MKEITIKNSKIRLIQGDITESNTEVIVNAANAQLILGGGVAGAIRRKGGPQIQKECDKIGGTFVGGAVITTGGELKAKFVIHAVGPQMGEGNEDEKLRNAVINSLKLMEENELKSISFPAISTGIFGYPIERCSEVMISAAKEFLTGKTQIEEVIFCLYSKADYEVFYNELNLL
jgi:O-acetyl-ADP-ribose deacetylase (regulator of RNase III)